LSPDKKIVGLQIFLACVAAGPVGRRGGEEKRKLAMLNDSVLKNCWLCFLFDTSDDLLKFLSFSQDTVLSATSVPQRRVGMTAKKTRKR